MNKKYGLTLIETIVVLTIVAMLLTISVISVKTLQNSFIGSCSITAIKNLLNLARSTALAKQSYVGVRFQKKDKLQYAVLITQNRNIPYPDDDITIPFTALEGHPPYNLGREDINDTTILFSSQGKLVRKWVQAYSNPDSSKDDIFGSDGLFPEDTNSKLSNMSLVINDKTESKEFFVNSYIGTLISR